MLIHGAYQQRGGEDVSLDRVISMLESRGHRVVTYRRDNREILDHGVVDRARLATGTIWSLEAQRDIGALIRRERPDVAHVFNTFPLISPAGLAACHRAGVPVVFKVPNYRLTCANAYLYRDGGRCEDCLHRTIKWPAVLHACYHGSRARSALVAGMITTHSVLRSWTRHVDVVLAVSEAVRRILVDAGIPDRCIEVCHNMVTPDPGDRSPGELGEGALFVGRLSPEKGVDVLLAAARRVPELPVRIVGDGPQRAPIEDEVRRGGLSNVELMGAVPMDRVFDLMRRARVLVVPSQWHEPFGNVVAEAFACGLPVIVSDLGALPELVPPEVGRVIGASDVGALADALRWAHGATDELAAMGRAARARYLEAFTVERAYDRTMEIYGLAAERAARRSSDARQRRLRS